MFNKQDNNVTKDIMKMEMKTRIYMFAAELAKDMEMLIDQYKKEEVQ